MMNDPLQSITALLVEDEADLRRETAAFLELYCKHVIPADNGREALSLCGEHLPDIVISDIRMPVMDGLEMAHELKRLHPSIPVILCTAYTETAYLLKAIELGVTAFVRKPVNTDELLAAIVRAALPGIQRREIENLNTELAASVSELMGGVPALKDVADAATRIARTSFSVLLSGETGTGKTRLAGIIHRLSPRRDAPFMSIQMAAIPETLAESQLFGHVKGAFTGADRNRAGLLETAAGGTVFLDDIESCPAGLQAKLLHFVESRRFTQVGSTREIESDVRIIAASNRDLKKEAAESRFREDLYYRLADFTIYLPPLRQSRDAIVPLALSFLKGACDELGRDLPILDDNAAKALANAPWPGNIRQLKSAIRRAALNAGELITGRIMAEAIDPFPATNPNPVIGQTQPNLPPPFPCSMGQLEKWSLEQALAFCGGMRMKTAAMLGMNYYTFRRRLEKHGIATEDK